MSIESAKAFIERMKTDQELGRKVAALKTPEEFQSFAAGQGYDFTLAELREAAAANLSQNDLEKVSGGKGIECPTFFPVSLFRMG